jgi:hypothetical protein
MGGSGVIRQAISCDICATEKRQTNHWFVAYEQAGELRVSGWSSRHKLRPGSKHLCGQTCLHKLVDEFMAKSIAVRARRPVEEPAEQPAEQIDPEPLSVGDASLTSSSAYEPLETSARLISPPPAIATSVPAITTPAPVLPRPVYRPQPEPVSRPQPELVTTPPRPRTDYAPAVEETPRYTSRNWRAEAWERERERELRAIDNRPGIAARRASNA